MRCCLETLAEYEGTEEVGTKIGCKFHEDKDEPMMVVTKRGWEWVGIGTPQPVFCNSRLVLSANSHDALIEALGNLRNEVSGSLYLSGVREAIGNTNFACLEQRIMEAEAALKLDKESQ